MDPPSECRNATRKRATSSSGPLDAAVERRTRRKLTASVDDSATFSLRRSPRRLGLLTPEASSLAAPAVQSSHTSNESNVEEAPTTECLFPFLELPAELRLHVYRMALQRDEPLLLHLNRRVEKKVNPKHDEFCYDPEPAADDTPPSSAALATASINVALLRTCKLIYKEARQVLYAENIFTLLLPTGIPTLSHLHQRSRSLIKNVELTVPSHHDILDGFADLVRLGLRYCWRLKTFTIVLDGVFPDDRVLMSGATSVYATAFHILRFLPRQCEVKLTGEVSEVVKKVVEEEARLLMELDEESHLRRQHQMPDRR